MDKKFISVSLLVFFLMFLIPLADASEVQKPVIAIKEAIVADGVKDSVKPYLNLGKLLAEMEASFLATRKFDLVTRNKSSMEAVRDEQQFGESDLSAGDAAVTGNMKNANFLILPEIHRFAFYRKTHKVPNLQSKYFKRDHGTLEMNAQIIDSSTGQIKTTFYLKDSFSTKEEMVNKSVGVPNSKYFTTLAKGVSAQMADQFLELIFPVEIISIKGDKVYLNRGQDGGYAKGNVLDVFIKGEELIDPHTGEDLGSAEEHVGKIKVSSVKPKFTLATILTDTMTGEMSVGCVVRKP